MHVNGSLTKFQHQEFWSEFRELDRATKGQFIEFARTELPAAVNYQRALWRAARESVKQRKPVVTADLQREFDEMDRHETKYPKRRGSVQTKKQARELLDAAAFQSPITLDGRLLHITPEAIDGVLKGLDASAQRLERLLNPTWQAVGAS